MQINKFLVLCALMLLSNSSNCARYYAKKLKDLEILSEQAQSLSFNYHVFTESDCKKYLGRKTVIYKCNPIQIAFTNNSNRHIMLSLNNFSFKCIPYSEISESIHFNTYKRVIGWGIASLFIWPLIVPAIIEGMFSPQANEDLDMDFSKKALKNQIVAPFKTAKGVIFVDKDEFNPEFSFTVIDSETNEKFVLSTNNQINDIAKPIISYSRK